MAVTIFLIIRESWHFAYIKYPQVPSTVNNPETGYMTFTTERNSVNMPHLYLNTIVYNHVSVKNINTQGLELEFRLTYLYAYTVPHFTDLINKYLDIYLQEISNL